MLDTLLQKLDVIDFWNAPTSIKKGGMDGAEWILEGYKNGKYHFLTRWSPDFFNDTNFMNACEYLAIMGKSNLKKKKSPNSF